ncbi:exopolyphosphatase / guanosine-5'-triphosphate,3'-diphosphate pyrophosphatase [Psychrobacillus sp. OK028]|uniref:Ppx/GppA family phosphatase n=1 Tax=Psychrobacillus sp. OK028 TaxID=1884359 RepID=UPI0008807E05|nr:Ppx/GppA family phosphatase [Psychrobacillus sp. OK028]SDN05317.1 exopolyphosphatase / guanosine-5'-triphosphate,3'-diphosphate pyrophosphatase [Psychrobacillus sp. OK028]
METYSKQKAIIDIGSNSIRLVVFSYSQAEGLIEHYNFKTVARLSMHIDEKGNLTEEGQHILIETLLKFNKILNDIHVTDVFAAATAAIRQANNRESIIQRAKKQTGIMITLVSAKEEAEYGYLAVIHSTNIPTAVTVDMGGGSTEITYFENKEIKFLHSFPFGAVSLKKKFITGSLITKNEKENLIEYVREQFQSLVWLHNLQVPIIAIGGSARNIAQVDQQRKNYSLHGIHQHELSRTDLQELSYGFSNASLEGLKKIDGLSSDRADIIVPALETFRVFMDIVQGTSFIYSKKGLREGVILAQLIKQFPADFDENKVSLNAIRHLLGKFHVKEEKSLHLYEIFSSIYDTFAQWGYITPLNNKELLRYAFQLFHIGKEIDQDAFSQHTFYLITNLTIDGISNKDRLKLALLSSYKNKDTFKQYIEPFQHIITNAETKQLRDIGALIRFTKGMDILGRSHIKDVSIKKSDNILEFAFSVVGNYLLEQYQADKLKKHIEKIVQVEVKLTFVDMEEL